MELPDGYNFIHVPQGGEEKDHKLCIDISIESQAELNKWISEMAEKNNVTWRKARGDRQRRGKLEVTRVCHHAKNGPERSQNNRHQVSIQYVLYLYCTYEC